MEQTRKEKHVGSSAALLPKQYRHYMFDLYGTLVDIHTDEQADGMWEKLAFFFGYYGALYAPDELKDRYGALVKAAEQELACAETVRYAHEASPEIEITGVFLALYREKGITADRTLAVHTGQVFRALSTDYVRLYPGTKEMLQKLRAQGKHVWLLSNAQRIFTAYEIRMLGIEDCFEDIFISSDHGTKKPDPRFFQALLDKHAIEPSESLYVGNDSRCDVAGAHGVGMDAFYVGSNLSPEGDDGSAAEYYTKHFTEWGTEDA